MSAGLKKLLWTRLSCEPHPDQDRLHVCEVDVGEEEPFQIVCGALMRLLAICDCGLT